MTTNRITRAKVLETLLEYINRHSYNRAFESAGMHFEDARTYMHMAGVAYDILKELGFEEGVDFERRIASRDGVEYTERIPIKGGRK